MLLLMLAELEPRGERREARVCARQIELIFISFSRRELLAKDHQPGNSFVSFLQFLAAGSVQPSERNAPLGSLGRKLSLEDFKLLISTPKLSFVLWPPIYMLDCDSINHEHSFQVSQSRQQLLNHRDPTN